VTAPQPGEIEVEDQLERRIRKPVDLLRCVVSCFGIVALAVAGIAARATMSRVETGIVGAGRRLPHALLVVAPPLALFALFILPVAMAVQLLVRRQFRRLGEAVATGVLATVVTAIGNDLLTRPAASRLYYAIIMARPGTSHAAALDPYLAGLVAYATMAGLAGRLYWRNALWAAIAVYAIVQAGARPRRWRGRRQAVHPRDQGGQSHQHQLARREQIVSDRGGGDVGECVKDRCLISHRILLQLPGTRGRWPPLGMPAVHCRPRTRASPGGD
jgi:MFS family permease